MNLAFRSRIRFTAARRMLPGALLGILLAAGGVAPSAAVTFEMVSLDNTDLPPTSTGNDTDQPAVTPDGRYVAFVSSSNFASGNGNRQVYVRERQSGTTELISQSSGGAVANSNSTDRVSISNDGCRVVFQSYATNLVTGDNNGTGNIFVRNRCTVPQTTQMVDVQPNGTPATGQGLEARISGDGSKVAFTSYSNNLVSGLLNGSGQACSDAIYVRDLNTQTTSALTMPVTGACVSGRSPDLSYDGNRIVFHSTTGYVAADTNGMWDIYLYDVTAPAAPFTLVSASSVGAPQQQNDGVNGGEGISSISEPAISRDGRMVTFRSRAYGLVPGVPSGTSQIYVKDTATGDIIVASVDASGVLGNADSGNGARPGISGDGQFVVFTTAATNLSPTTGGVWPNVIMHDNFRPRTIGFTNQSAAGLPEISGDPLGRYVTFSSGNALDPRFTSRGYFLSDRYLWLNFTDVAASNWALPYINAIFDMGITTGCGGGKYCPTQQVTRDQMAAFIIRALEGEPAACSTAPFGDVPASHGMCKYIKRMLERSITTGCGNGNYCPSAYVDRQQMAAFIIRAVEGEPAACATQPFNDISASHGMCKYIKRMKDLNITTGCGNNNYCPTQIVTRDQMAAFLARAFLGM